MFDRPQALLCLRVSRDCRTFTRVFCRRGSAVSRPPAAFLLFGVRRAAGVSASFLAFGIRTIRTISSCSHAPENAETRCRSCTEHEFPKPMPRNVREQDELRS